MDDLEATRLCAEAMELPQPIENRNGAIWCGGHTTRGFSGKEPYRVGGLHYRPLHDDAQAMALVKHFRLHIDQRPGKHVTAQDPHFLHLIERPDGQLNAAVVYCVAAMQRAKGAG